MPNTPPLLWFANWLFTQVAGTPGARGVTEHGRADAEGGGGVAEPTGDDALRLGAGGQSERRC